MKKFLAVLGLTVQDIKYAIRSALFAFLAVFIPGALGWLNTVTEWLNDTTKPIPDWHTLGALVGAAAVAGFTAVLTLVWRAVEGKTGKALLRPNPTPPQG